MNRMHKLSLLLVCTLLATVAIGCSDPVNSRISEITKHNAKKVAIMYKVFSDGNQFLGPKDEDEFKSWIQSDDKIKERLAKFGVDVNKFDSYMLDRSGEKFEIRWSVQSAPMAPPYPVALETTAVDGIRQVGMAGGPMREVDNDEEFEKLRNGETE